MEGTRLKKLMKYHGISNNDMADKLGMTPQNLSFLLSRDDIRTGLLEQMCDIMGISPAELYGGANLPPVTVTDSKQIAINNSQVNSDKLIEEIAAQRRITEKAQQQIDRLLAIIEQLSNK